MNKKIDIGQKAKVVVKWNVHQSNYSKELEKSIISLMAQKYNIPEKNISVETNYSTTTNSGIIENTATQNIHDPKFQQELMKQFIAVNENALLDTLLRRGLF